MAKYSRDAASKCMKIHMARDKYIMGNNRLSRARKIEIHVVAGGDKDARDAVDIVGTESCCCNSVVTLTAHAKVDAGAAQLISAGTASVRTRQMSCRWMWSAGRERERVGRGGVGRGFVDYWQARNETNCIDGK